MGKVLTLIFIYFVMVNADPIVNSVNTTTTSTDCPTHSGSSDNPALSALLIQMLVALQPHVLQQTTNQQQQFKSVNLQNNEIVNNPSAVVKSRTIVLTSSTVSTVTDTFYKVVSIWFRNERIPTTVYSSTTRLVTETLTVTSVIPMEPTEIIRERREAVIINNNQPQRLDPSFPMTTDVNGFLSTDETISIRSSTPPLQQQLLPLQGVPDLLTRPRVHQAWKDFVQILMEESNKLDEE